MIRAEPFAGAFQLGIEPDLYATPGEHIAYFWSSDDDFARGVKFLETGLAEGDAAIVFGYDEANARVLSILRASNALQEITILRGASSAAAMLATIGATFDRLTARGATRLRLLGNIGWGREGWPSDEETLAFEQSVTSAIAGRPCVVVCMYDVRALPADITVRAGFGTHPSTLAREALE